MIDLLKHKNYFKLRLSIIVYADIIKIKFIKILGDIMFPGLDRNNGSREILNFKNSAIEQNVNFSSSVLNIVKNMKPYGVVYNELINLQNDYSRIINNDTSN